MGRPSIYGRQLVTDKYNRFIGVNLGYNFYCEHEGDVTEVANDINRYTIGINSQSVRNKMKLNKSAKLIKRWKNTPFGKTNLLSITPYLRREVIIDNLKIINKYKTFILDSCDYVLLYIGNMTTEDWHRKFGDRRKFSENELLYMNDYQSNTGLRNKMDITYESMMYGDKSFVGSWSLGSNNILILEKKIERPCGCIVDSIITSLQNGNLALANGEDRLFKDRGLQLIDLEAAYLTGRR